MAAQIVQLYLDHERFGCGWRNYVAIEGRKWVRVVLIATGESARISIADYRKAYVATKPWSAASIRKRLRRNARTYGNDKSPAVKEALALLQ